MYHGICCIDYDDINIFCKSQSSIPMPLDGSQRGTFGDNLSWEWTRSNPYSYRDGIEWTALIYLRCPSVSESFSPAGESGERGKISG